MINGEPFNSRTATGICLSRLFGGWPHDKIRQVYTTPIALDTSVCSSNWRLGPGNYRIGSWLRKINIWTISNSEASTQISAMRQLVNSNFRHEINPVIDLLQYRVEAAFLAWIDDFNPQIVYSCLSSLRTVRLVEFVAKRFHAPVVPHIQDDWWAAPYQGAWAALLIGPLLRRSFRRLLKRTPIILTIGEEMSSEYMRRFGLPCRHYMNCLEDEWIDRWGQDRQVCDGIKIAVIGNLNTGRVALVRELAESLCKAGSDLGTHKVALNFYSHTKSAAALLTAKTSNCVSFRAPPADDELLALFNENSLVLHLEGFGRADRKFFRLSMSGKLPVYLASGRPILVYGPEGGGTAKYLRKNNCGMVVGERNQEALTLAIKALASDTNLRSALVKQAFCVLNRSYRRSVVGKSFQDTLKQVASPSDRI